jgi:serine/threonine protein kinase
MRDSPPLPESKDTLVIAGDAPHRVSLDASGAFQRNRVEDRYAEMGVLGRGGMGVVKLCRDRRIGRELALKIERDSRSGDGARFVREALVQGQLEHPAIVPVYDVGVDEGGAAYFTMKRVRGLSLADVLENRRSRSSVAEAFSQRRLLSALARVCMAVDFAHSSGVVHRDLKPANVMLGDWGEVYVLDWGLARLCDGGEASEGPETTRGAQVEPGREPLTEAGALLGTPGYMAPEQVDGQDVGPAADVYALGAMLFEVLTLERLHPGPTPEVRARATVLGAAAGRLKRLEELGVAPELIAICDRATQLEQGNRFPRARALHDALQEHVEGHRDLELRQHLSERHAEAAKALVAQLRRKEAMRELGRALALNPGNANAVHALVELLGTSPAELPDEVDREMQADYLQREHEAQRRGTRATLAFLVIAAAVLVMGVREIAPLVVIAAPVVVLPLLRCGRAGTAFRRQLVAYAVLTISMLAMARLFGSLVFLPTVVATVAGSFAFHSPRVRRFGVILPVALLAVLGPLGLEAWGVLEPTYAVRDGAIAVLPHIASFMPHRAVPILAFLSAIAVTVPVLMFGAMGDAVEASKKRMMTQGWQLRQLVPEVAHESIPPP